MTKKGRQKCWRVGWHFSAPNNKNLSWKGGIWGRRPGRHLCSVAYATVYTSGVNLVWNLGCRGPGAKNFDFLGKFPKYSDSFRQFHKQKTDFSGQIFETFRFFQVISNFFSIFQVKLPKNFDFLGNFPKYFDLLGKFTKNFDFFRQFHKNIDFQGTFKNNFNF